MSTSTRRKFLARSAAGMAWAAQFSIPAGRAFGTPPSAPNLLFVLVDQMRAHTQAFMNEDPTITPNLDRFSRESLVLTQAVSNAPVCSPYRGMMMTGKYPVSSGVPSNTTSKYAPYGNELPEDARCWSDILSDRGYSLGYIGKWHLDAPRKPYVKSYNNRPDFAWNEWCPPNRRHGFDFWYSYGTFDMHNAPEYWSTDMKRHERVKVHQWGPEHETDLAIRYLKNHGGEYRRGDRPFALVVSMNPPHTPYEQVPEKYVQKYGEKTWEDLLIRPNVDTTSDEKVVRQSKAQIKNYFAMVTGVDDQFGRLLGALEKMDLQRDTIVVFTSDHGNCIGSNGMWTKNNHYEESMRIPFMIRWPGKIPARHDKFLFSVPDLYPSLMGLMGFEKDIPDDLEGENHAAFIKGQPSASPSSQFYFRANPDNIDEGQRGVRTGRYTLVTNNEGSYSKLFDNEKDPYQMKDIAAENPEIVRDLIRNELNPWLRKTKDPWGVLEV